MCKPEDDLDRISKKLLAFFFFNWGCVLTGREITTGDGDEKGLLDDSKLNTRYKDTGADKKQGVPEGITRQ